jgi:bifunctional phosphoserine phosphatase/homoserine phosphotransferase
MARRRPATVLSGRRVRVYTDLESVLVPELWPTLGAALQVPEFQLTTRDVQGLDELMSVRLKCIRERGFTLRQLKACAEAHIRPYPGASELLRELSEKGVEVVVLSDTFEQLMEHVLHEIGVKRYYTNRLVVEGDQIVGFDLALQGAKHRLLEEERGEDVLSIAIGDSFNDVLMLRAADLPVLFNPAEPLKDYFRGAPVFRNLGDLRRFLLALTEAVARPPKVLVADGIAEQGLRLLRKAFRVDVMPKLMRQELLELIGEYEAIIVRSATRVDQEVLSRAAALKAIARAGIGLDNIDLRAARQRGVKVLYDPYGSVISVAEHTLLLMLALSRDLVGTCASVKSGRWEKDAYAGRELYGKTLLIVGLGKIGSEVAKRAKAFGMRVIAYDPYAPQERFSALGVLRAQRLDEALMEADYVTVHTPKVQDLIAERELGLLKPGAFLINTARGGVVNQEALYRALVEGRLAGAALDVFEREPPAEQEMKLLSLPNVIATPHVAGSTAEAQERISAYIALTLVRCLLGERVENEA